MDYKIGHAGDDEVTIDLVDTTDRAPQVLEALQECQEGRCRCPTDQYERLAGMDIATRGGAIRVRLRPRGGTSRHRRAELVPRVHRPTGRGRPAVTSVTGTSWRAAMNSRDARGSTLKHRIEEER